MKRCLHIVLILQLCAMSFFAQGMNTLVSKNEAPVADAGSDPTGIREPWAQTDGPAISLSGANTAWATFAVPEGQSSAFRLAVTDDRGTSSVARVLDALAPLHRLLLAPVHSGVRTSLSPRRCPTATQAECSSQTSLRLGDSA